MSGHKSYIAAAAADAVRVWMKGERREGKFSTLSARFCSRPVQHVPDRPKSLASQIAQSRQCWQRWAPGLGNLRYKYLFEFSNSLR